MIINQSAYIVINHLKFLIKISFLRLRLKGKKGGVERGGKKLVGRRGGCEEREWDKGKGIIHKSE